MDCAQVSTVFLSTELLFFAKLWIVPTTGTITHTPHPGAVRVLSRDAVEFIASLHRTFENHRRSLLTARAERQGRLNAGERPDFLTESVKICTGILTVREAPKALWDRRVEITGPVERKMMIHALNSGAKVFMADFEDANCVYDPELLGEARYVFERAALADDVPDFLTLLAYELLP